MTNEIRKLQIYSKRRSVLFFIWRVSYARTYDEGNIDTS